ncbi:MAG: thioredoxin family protein [Syntrophotalea acetylenica]|jgi:small redox-active disulfide protein 2|nr:thioredoxin family protein [Syntrophotalea acetylenica]MDY0262781.1 thioredoxin family protein [Syntrophotalea acetylenica]
MMKKIQILGSGCKKCQTLYEQAQAVADALGIEYEMVKVTDIKEITAFGVMMTPALAVDGEVKVSGKIPKPDELKKYLS